MDGVEACTRQPSGKGHNAWRGVQLAQRCVKRSPDYAAGSEIKPVSRRFPAALTGVRNAGRGYLPLLLVSNRLQPTAKLISRRDYLALNGQLPLSRFLLFFSSRFCLSGVFFFLILLLSALSIDRIRSQGLPWWRGGSFWCTCSMPPRGPKRAPAAHRAEKRDKKGANIDLFRVYTRRAGSRRVYTRKRTCF